MISIKIDTSLQVFREDNDFLYGIVSFPFGICTFEEALQKCEQLKEQLSDQGVVDVYIPSKEECKSMPESIRACDLFYWTSSTLSDRRYYVSCGGDILFSHAHYLMYGFRPVIKVKKQRG